MHSAFEHNILYKSATAASSVLNGLIFSTTNSNWTFSCFQHVTLNLITKACISKTSYLQLIAQILFLDLPIIYPSPFHDLPLIWCSVIPLEWWRLAYPCTIPLYKMTFRHSTAFLLLRSPARSSSPSLDTFARKSSSPPARQRELRSGNARVDLSIAADQGFA